MVSGGLTVSAQERHGLANKRREVWGRELVFLQAHSNTTTTTVHRRAAADTGLLQGHLAFCFPINIRIAAGWLEQ